MQKIHSLCIKTRKNCAETGKKIKENNSESKFLKKTAYIYLRGKI